MIRGDLEFKISNALRKITPSDMQRLAGDYVLTKHPERFPEITETALSPEGQTTRAVGVKILFA